MEQKLALFKLKMIATEYNAHSISVCHAKDEKPTYLHVLEGKKHYLLQDMIDLAFRTAYLKQCSDFCCTIVRIGKTTVVEDFTAKHNCVKKIVNETQPITFGADVEYMIANKESGKFQSLKLNQSELERLTDGAMIRQGYTFYKPIFELHPKPADSGKQLFEHVHHLYEQQEEKLKNTSLETISVANPIDRFFLGGHLHFGNVSPTFKKTSQLDALLALPLMINDSHSSSRRRKTLVGGLGNVRHNSYRGFEYRTLSSWYHHIPYSEPLFEWIDWIMNNHTLPWYPLPTVVRRAYEEGDKKVITDVVDEMFTSLKTDCSSSDRDVIDRFHSWIQSQRFPLST
ncbi:putative amidoligase domain-containing protein [Alteribacter aurantiacus]|uniref:putative amidoligase domain-containing protein n=1 Tax=Alteribacter aurantiacus TaxID=254410 RepID=UPI00041909C8|nr:hypothetical protein [Alteribacter aurantiacus]